VQRGLRRSQTPDQWEWTNTCTQEGLAYYVEMGIGAGGVSAGKAWGHDP